MQYVILVAGFWQAHVMELIGPSPFDSDTTQVRDYHHDGSPYVGNVPSSEVFGLFDTRDEAEAVIQKATAESMRHNQAVLDAKEQVRIANAALKRARKDREELWRAGLRGAE